MAERIKDGLSLDKAREGLDEVILSEYPSSSIFDELVDSIEVESEKSDDALTIAMADLINKSKVDEEEDESEIIEKINVEIPLESRDPLHHGSISRARQVRSELRSPPVHSGWTNIANRTEVLRNEHEINTPQFNKFMIKVIMTSTNQAKPPRIKNFRAIALRSFEIE